VKIDFSSILRKRFHLPHAETTRKAVHSFSLTERVVFWVLFAIFALSALIMLVKVNNHFLVSVPVKGGELTEGILGSPRFVNPLLAISDADRDVTALVYSGLLRATPNGELVPDLADRYEISEDGLTYTFFLKEDIRFHDGTALTADDVEFTLTKAQEPNLKSPRRANWEGVTIEKISDKEIRFILKQPYAPFLENVTLGILPKHIWKNATVDEFAFSEYNILAIGSGPYKIRDVNRNSAGLPNEYVLRANSSFALGEPYIGTLRLKFYGNEASLAEALESADVESVNSLSAALVKEFENNGRRVETAVLPRVFGVFFNQNEATLFTNKEVRMALNEAIDKNTLVKNILSGYGSAIDGPIPREADPSIGDLATSSEAFILKAQATLENAGWKKNEETGVYEKKGKSSTMSLAFSIATGDAPELKHSAAIIEETWEKLGASVDVEIYETGDLNQSVIRPRKYSSLLFGEIIGRNMDLFPFWHSSQRNDPGLNIALYVNNSADRLLEQARTITDTDERNAKYSEFEEKIKEDTPAVFLYSPSFLYIVPKKIENLRLGGLTVPSDRFLGIHTWYIETSKVWKIFN